MEISKGDNMKIAKYIVKTLSYAASIAGIIALVWTFCTYGGFVRAALSVKQLNDHFYYMEFSGNSQLQEFLARGGAETNGDLAVYIENLLRGKRINKVYKEPVPLNTGCAAIEARTPDGKQLFGRNYDWNNLKTAVIFKCNPKHGYKSISTVQLDFVGFGDDFAPDTFGHKYLTTAAMFVPLDGMNEKGLCISDLMAGDDEETHQDAGLSDVTTTLAIRSILDFCADVPEALAFLENHDMHSVIGRAHHFAISDATGRMVVVEYVNNAMIVTETDAVTNHYLGVEKQEITRENSQLRLNVLRNHLDANETLTEDEVKNALYDIRSSQYRNSYGKTWWRAVYNQSDLTVHYAFEEHYAEEDCLTFKL